MIGQKEQPTNKIKSDSTIPKKEEKKKKASGKKEKESEKKERVCNERREKINEKKEKNNEKREKTNEKKEKVSEKEEKATEKRGKANKKKEKTSDKEEKGDKKKEPTCQIDEKEKNSPETSHETHSKSQIKINNPQETRLKYLIRIIKETDHKQRPCKIHGGTRSVPKLRTKTDGPLNSDDIEPQPKTTRAARSYFESTDDQGASRVSQFEVCSNSLSSLNPRNSYDKIPTLQSKKSILKSNNPDPNKPSNQSRTNIRFESFQDDREPNEKTQSSMHRLSKTTTQLNRKGTNNTLKPSKMNFVSKFFFNDHCHPEVENPRKEKVEGKKAPLSYFTDYLGSRAEAKPKAKSKPYQSRTSVNILSKFNHMNSNQEDFCQSGLYKKSALSLLQKLKTDEPPYEKSNCVSRERLGDESKISNYDSRGRLGPQNEIPNYASKSMLEPQYEIPAYASNSRLEHRYEIPNYTSAERLSSGHEPNQTDKTNEKTAKETPTDMNTSASIVSELDAISLLSETTDRTGITKTENHPLDHESNSTESAHRSCSLLRQLNEEALGLIQPSNKRPVHIKISNMSDSSCMETSCSSDCSGIDCSSASGSSRMDVGSFQNSTINDNNNPAPDIEMNGNTAERGE